MKAQHFVFTLAALLLSVQGQSSARKWRMGRSSVHGHGVFATVSLEANQEVDCVAFQATHDLDALMALKRLIEITAFGQLVNHSWDANTVIRRKDHEQWWLYANATIRPGEELVANYNARPHPWFLSGAPLDWK